MAHYTPEQVLATAKPRHGITRARIVLDGEDTAGNPRQNLAPFRGPAVVLYTRSPDGWVSARAFDRITRPAP